ncbi:MAG TPA: class I SAM-dependent methyltransferase [Bacteroidia bacterium]|jgi:SAM-dependent methyltransferase
MSENKVAEFYDKYVDQQQNTGINERIYGLYKRMLKLGLNADSNVLELGCGIGVMSYLLSTTVKNGNVECVDISPASVAFAEKRLKRDNMKFTAADVVNYSPSGKNFDIITLFDVIEHIPLEKHGELFKNLSGIANEKTRILVNIPNPSMIEHDRIHRPETLQVIDQPVPLHAIAQHLENNHLELAFFETYSIWMENDFQFFIIQKKKPFREVKLSEKRTVFEKAIKKLERNWMKLAHRYK